MKATVVLKYLLMVVGVLFAMGTLYLGLGIAAFGSQIDTSPAGHAVCILGGLVIAVAGLGSIFFLMHERTRVLVPMIVLLQIVLCVVTVYFGFRHAGQC